ncbi:MAG: hypothetical protein AAAFM81_08600 [Pseudomonadota bacterium]
MRDARRRNRNIGTAASGHGQDNRHVVSERWVDWDWTPFWQDLKAPRIVERDIHGTRVSFIVEPPRDDCRYACTVDDVCHVLKLLPKHHTRYIALVIMRQPTRRQEILRPVWGRLGYWSQICGCEGPGIYLEARSAPEVQHWSSRLAPDDQRELARLEEDGHTIERVKRGYQIRCTYASIRNTLLYRTVPHEVGHYVDYLTFKTPDGIAHASSEFWDLYDAKPGKDKENFAHRYADEFRALMKSAGNFPFRQLRDPSSIKLSGLEPEWFANIEPDF